MPWALYKTMMEAKPNDRKLNGTLEGMLVRIPTVLTIMGTTWVLATSYTKVKDKLEALEYRIAAIEQQLGIGAFPRAKVVPAPKPDE